MDHSTGRLYVLKTGFKINDAVIPSPTEYNLKNAESVNLYTFQIQLGKIIASFEHFWLKYVTGSCIEFMPGFH